MAEGPSARMLQLLSLLQGGRTWPAAELARRLGAPPRTLRRDLHRLRELGYPVRSERGPGGGYRLVAGQAMPPLLLTDDEAVATLVGLRFATLAEVHGETGVAESALAKLERVLPARLRGRVRDVAAAIEMGSRPYRTLDLDTLRRLATAAVARRHVRFAYTGRSGACGERRAEPYLQVYFSRHWYLLAWDRVREDWRTFRMDRIRDLEVLGTTFRARALPAEGAASFVQNRAGRPAARGRAAVRFHAPVEVVAERLIAEAGSLEAVDAGQCRYVGAVDSWEWLAMTLAMVGVDYTIEGPPELVTASRAVAARIVRACRS